MEPSHRFLPERKNRGNRMSELAKDEGKMLEDDKDGIFKEDSSDDDFNPDDVKKDLSIRAQISKMVKRMTRREKKGKMKRGKKKKMTKGNQKKKRK